MTVWNLDFKIDFSKVIVYHETWKRKERATFVDCLNRIDFLNGKQFSTLCSLTEGSKSIAYATSRQQTKQYEGDETFYLLEKETWILGDDIEFSLFS